MGVCSEEAPKITGMHWQQHERYIGPAYDPSRDLSPNLPVHCSDSSSMGEGDGATSSTSSSSATSCSGTNSTTTTDCSNNNSCSVGLAPSCCRVGAPVSSGGGSTTYDYKLQPPQSPPACKLEDSSALVMCAGCGNRISDRYYLRAVDQRWHTSCLQCCQCRQTLDGEMTCFSRDGNIYCKKDYYRLFGMKRCGRCQAAISSSELVMRARDLVFHVHCFTCSVCLSPLTKGDHFGMHGPNVFCQLHYENTTANSTSSPCPPPSMQTPNYHNPYNTPPFPSPNEYHHHSSPVMSQLPPTNPNALPPQPPPNASPCALEHSSKVQSFFNGGTTTARQKGRPRKRKPKDLESMTANLDLNTDSYLDVNAPFGRSGPSPGGGMSGSSSQSQRTKRMRTSFKHHQLRTMKSYFAINHNPDAKDLKQLSQKTGLPKRVLQVWFQNARAKWRRMMIKQDGKIPSEKGLGSPSDLQHLHHGGSQSGSDYPMHLDASCSPEYMMPSPPSLDC